jgi:hypothetical protein
VVIFASFLAFSSGASASSDPYADAASVIACPPGPAGWSVPATPGGRVVEDPLTPNPVSPRQLWGGDQFNLDCNYQTSTGGRLKLTVRYALPTIAFNPVSDFDFGCTASHSPVAGANATVLWNTKTRLYRVVSSKAWVYATFTDPYRQLSSSNVTVFESATRQMLAHAQPLAHKCPITLAPQALVTLWTYGFNARIANNGLTTTGTFSGTFLATSQPAGGLGAVSQLRAPDFGLQVTNGSTSLGSVAVGLSQPQFQNGVFTAQVAIGAASTYPPCAWKTQTPGPNGGTIVTQVANQPTGTLTINANQGTVTLQACGQDLLAGTGQYNLYITGAA